MVRQLNILDVYSFYRHLESLKVDDDPLMMARGIIVLPQFVVLTDDKGVYIVLEMFSKDSCKLHAYVSPDSRGKQFLKALKDAQEWVKVNTSYLKVYFFLTDESVHAELFLRQYNVSLIQEGMYPVYVFDLYKDIKRELSSSSLEV